MPIFDGRHTCSLCAGIDDRPALAAAGFHHSGAPADNVDHDHEQDHTA